MSRPCVTCEPALVPQSRNNWPQSRWASPLTLSPTRCAWRRPARLLHAKRVHNATRSPRSNLNVALCSHASATCTRCLHKLSWLASTQRHSIMPALCTTDSSGFDRNYPRFRLPQTRLPGPHSALQWSILSLVSPRQSAQLAALNAGTINATMPVSGGRTLWLPTIAPS